MGKLNRIWYDKTIIHSYKTSPQKLNSTGEGHVQVLNYFYPWEVYVTGDAGI